MSNSKFNLSYKGVGELLKSEEMQAVLTSKARDIRERCGDGYEQDIHVGETRANASVSATTYKAKKDNLKNNTLLKAVR
nr:MAG TPA: type I neck protein [Bacteriophage sp.]